MLLRFKTGFHFLGSMRQNLFGFLKVFDFELLAVEFGFFLLQIFLDVFLHIFEHRNLVQVRLLGLLQLLCRHSFGLSLPFENFSLLLQPVFLPLKGFHVGFKFSNYLLQLLNLFSLLLLNGLYLVFLFLFLHREFLLVDHAKPICFSFASFVSFLHALKVPFELLE